MLPSLGASVWIEFYVVAGQTMLFRVPGSVQTVSAQSAVIQAVLSGGQTLEHEWDFADLQQDAAGIWVVRYDLIKRTSRGS
ncbi:MAG: hypothetical protein RLZZ187_3769 [Pseudomonadota bacterium]